MQQYLSIGALVLLSIIALAFYRASTNQTTISYANESMLEATAIGQSILEEIKAKAFDEMTVSAPCTTVAALTAPSSLGPDTSETANTFFDDIDDYNNYTRTVISPRLGIYFAAVQVRYVDPNTPESASGISTFAKQVSVFVTNEYLISPANTPDTLRLRTVIAY